MSVNNSLIIFNLKCLSKVTTDVELMQIYANNYLNWKRKDGTLENGNICWIANISGGLFGTRPPE